jgi:uncharacterized protein with GYD domain
MMPATVSMAVPGLRHGVKDQDNSAVFAAYLRCPTEARLLTRGETPSDTSFSDMHAKIAAAQRAKFETADLFAFPEWVAHPERGTGRVLVDSNTCYLEASRTTRKINRRPKGVEPGHDYVPVLLSPWDNADESDRVLLAVCALAIAHATQIQRSRAKKHGVTVKDVVWTLGAHDIVAIFEAPNDETATSVILSADELGNGRTETMRGFTAAEMEKLLAKVD